MNKRPTIGVLIGLLEESFQARIWPGMLDTAEELDANIIFFVGKAPGSNYGWDKQHHIVYNLPDERNIDGLVITSGSIANFMSYEKLLYMLNMYKPIPMSSVSIEIDNVPSVIVNNKVGLYELFDHLIRFHNYKKIAYIRGPIGHQEADLRFQVYKESLKKYNIPFNPALVYEGDFVLERGVLAADYFLKKFKNDIDVIVSANDDMALGAFKELKIRGIDVPKDIALVGFDDIDIVKSFFPPLTTVRQPLYNLGKKAFELVYHMLEGKKVPHTMLLPSRLVVRQSCGCFSQSVIQVQNSVVYSEDLGNYNKKVDIKKLTQNKNTIIESVIFDALGTDFKNYKIINWVSSLYDSICSNLNKKYDIFSFLYVVGKVPIHEITNILNDAVWQNVILNLKEKIFSYINNEELKLIVNSLFQKALVYIEEILLRPDAYKSIQKKHEKWLLRDISQSLITTFNTDELADYIKSELPKIGINSCFISLYQGKVKEIDFLKWSIPEFSRLILNFSEDCETEIIGIDRIFETYKLVPDFCNTDKCKHYVLMPLFFREEQFGYIIFDMGSRLETIYETLRGQISSSLKGALLFKKQRETEHLRIAKEAAEKASSIKSDFLANMSHEIRTPMNSVLGFTGILYDEENDEEKKNKLKIIMKAGKNLLDLINDILDFSKIEAGKINLENRVFSFYKLINDIRLMFLIRSNDNNILFNINIGKSVPDFIVSDERRLNQILMNLVSNAFKFTKKGSVSIDCSYNNEILKIKVFDTGIGIPEEKQELIFSSFTQADASTTREYGGTGLGLAIIKGIIENMGGKIYFISKVGEGSTFTVELPIKKAKNKNQIKNVEKDNKIDNLLFKWINYNENDPDIEKIIINSIKKMPQRLNELKELIKNKKYKEIGLISHELKGGTGTLGMRELYDLFQNTENAVNKRRIPYKKIKEFIQNIDEILNIVLKQVDKYEALKLNRNFKDFKILIAEDNEMNRDLVGVLLKGLGVNYEFAENGKKAIQMIDKNIKKNTPYNLLLLDMQMPIMDGLEVLENIKNNEKIEDLKIIALTAHAMKGDEKKYLDAGCDGYISKPIDKLKFKNKIRNIIMKNVNNLSNNRNKIKKEDLSEDQLELLQKIIKCLKRNIKIFNQEEVFQIADDLLTVSNTKYFIMLKNKLYKAANEFDDEIVCEVIEILGRI